MLCGDLASGMGEQGGGQSRKREGIYVYIKLIRFVVQQKLTQHGKALILKKINKIKPVASTIRTTFYQRTQPSFSSNVSCIPHLSISH